MTFNLIFINFDVVYFSNIMNIWSVLHFFHLGCLFFFFSSKYKIFEVYLDHKWLVHFDRIETGYY